MTACLSGHFLLLLIVVGAADWADLQDRGQTLTRQTKELAASVGVKQPPGKKLQLRCGKRDDVLLRVNSTSPVGWLESFS